MLCDKHLNHPHPSKFNEYHKNKPCVSGSIRFPAARSIKTVSGASKHTKYKSIRDVHNIILSRSTDRHVSERFLSFVMLMFALDSRENRLGSILDESNRNLWNDARTTRPRVMRRCYSIPRAFNKHIRLLIIRLRTKFAFGGNRSWNFGGTFCRSSLGSIKTALSFFCNIVAIVCRPDAGGPRMIIFGARKKEKLSSCKQTCSIYHRNPF